MNHLLGIGILSWPRFERIGDRYGSVFLMDEALTDYCNPVGLVRLTEGLEGRLVARVIETRQSRHIGDIGRGVDPSTPDKGERIMLGEGKLFYHQYREWPCVGLEPDDGREHDWLDIHALYRAHEQTVELVFEGTA